MYFFAMKWRPTWYKMVPDKLENGAQQTKNGVRSVRRWCPICVSKFDCRSFISKILWKRFAFCLPLSLSVISTSLIQPCCKCFNPRLALRWMCDSPRTGCGWRTPTTYTRREQAMIKWGRRVISVVTCCNNVKLCTLAARAFWSSQSGAVTRMQWCTKSQFFDSDSTPLIERDHTLWNF